MTTNPPFEMRKLLYIFQKTIKNPFFGVALSLVLMIPSLYIILEDITVIRIEYIPLAIGIPMYLKSLNRIFDDTLHTNKDAF